MAGEKQWLIDHGVGDHLMDSERVFSTYLHDEYADGLDHALRIDGSGYGMFTWYKNLPEVTSVGRRYELLAWANEPCVGGRCIVEDDYDCEFRLAGQPIPALQGVDATGRVIYANTFAKSLDPAFRLDYMVLPPHLSGEFEERLGFYSCTVSAIGQLALARFIERGDYECHMSRTRSHHRALGDNLVQALRGSSPGDRLVIQGADAGLHFLLGVHGAPCPAFLWNALERRLPLLKVIVGPGGGAGEVAVDAAA